MNESKRLQRKQWTKLKCEKKQRICTKPEKKFREKRDDQNKEKVDYYETVDLSAHESLPTLKKTSISINLTMSPNNEKP